MILCTKAGSLAFTPPGDVQKRNLGFRALTTTVFRLRLIFTEFASARMATWAHVLIEG